MAEGGAELGLKDPATARAGALRSAFAAFDKSRNKGLLLIDEAQVLAGGGITLRTRRVMCGWRDRRRIAHFGIRD
jgi:hypothetical protein